MSLGANSVAVGGLGLMSEVEKIEAVQKIEEVEEEKAVGTEETEKTEEIGKLELEVELKDGLEHSSDVRGIVPLCEQPEVND
jgi:hypothetical protein